MTNGSFPGGAADYWTALWRPWLAVALAPRDLEQPINSGWSFGNLIINDHNSSAPETERAILAEVSYGRQIGRLLDAVSELIKAQPDGGRDNPAFRDLMALEDNVGQLKRATAMRRIDQLRRDFALLSNSREASGKAAYAESLDALRALLADLDARR
jgi:hypothetical protein